ncbi:MAG TPA: adenylate/guanylate cyclase domain-containing protein [Gaiellaceae bacterium]|jgi:class 3 adenylate cyclase/tetratricopeptide (TPR) repeat protein
MVCASCGNENPAGARFCEGCGNSLAATCAACGTVASSGARFCSGCGAALAPAAALAPVGVPVAERRLVSVLFADLVGFTTLSESRDAEAVRDLLSRYFETCRRLIEAYGGAVEKFIGDAVMAVWGAPAATEQDAERAVRTGLDLAAAVSALGQELGAPDLRARVGVLTGEAAVTIGAVGEGMVAGDLVNTASRIQSVAEPGTVLVGELTREVTEATVVYEPAGSFELKGKTGETPLWRAVRVVSGARGALRSEGLEAPFVGRDRELRRVKETFHAAAEERRAHLLSVTGIGGIGKSRLAWEFFKYVDGLAQEIWWHHGRCLPYGEGVTYWALAEMIRMRCRIGEDDDPATMLAKLRATLEELVSDAGEREQLEQPLAQLIGVGEATAGDRLELFASWRLFFERLADQGPLVMVFEDVQWADSSLLDFVEYLLDWSRTLPIFVLTLGRPELLEKRAGWGSGLRHFGSMYLEPLPGDAMGQLLDGLVPGLPQALVAQILERAEGVPLYAVETVRMLLDRGALVRDGETYRAVGEVAELEVPATLHALIASRLDDLPAAERRLLQDAAVLGKTFSAEVVAVLAAGAVPDVEGTLRSLVRKEILALQADPLSPARGQYGFLQDLVRHVAYETLSRRERRARHLAAADQLAARLPDDEAVEMLASHLVEAAAADPDAPDASEIRGRAQHALAQAAERAASLGALLEATRYLTRALSLVDDERARADLELRAGELALRAGQNETARELLESATARLAQGGDRVQALRAALRLAESDRSEGRHTSARERVEAAVAALDESELEGPTAGEAFAALGGMEAITGDPAAAVSYLERALQIAEEQELPDVFTLALVARGLVGQRVGRLQEAEILFEGAVAHADRHGLSRSWFRAFNNLLVVFEMRERFRESLERGKEALRHSRRVGDRPYEAMCLTGELLPMVLLGLWDEALEALPQAEEVAEAVGTLTETMLLDVVEVLLARGEVAAAEELVSRFGRGELSDDPQSRGGFLIARARLELARGDPAAAVATARAAVETAREGGISGSGFKLALEQLAESALATGDSGTLAVVVDEIDALPKGFRTRWLRALRARCAARLGEPAELEEAERLFRDLEMPFRLAVVLLERAEALTGAEAEPLLEEARSIFARLRATRWLERAASAAAVTVP